MFLVLSVAIVPAGPENWLNGASVPSQAGCPGWLGGIPPGSWEARSDTSCPHCTCWDGGGRGLSDKYSSVFPREELPSSRQGGTERRDSGIEDILKTGDLSPSPAA